MVNSRFTGKEYDPNPQKICKIVNPTQIAAYIGYGVELLDLFKSEDHKTGKPILVPIFDKETSYEAYKLWCEHKLN